MTEISGELTMERFSVEVNTKFQMQYGDAQSAELELISVTDLGSSARQTQFSAVFLGPEHAPIRQGIYAVTHKTLGGMNLFLVPIAKDHEGIRYEAIFNRFL
ncbi:MAG TPA: hypothetical protein VJX67_13925 [Blastocatellia bacterium]|nr:hypothetical protein [Blastocatellia bacterium]